MASVSDPRVTAPITGLSHFQLLVSDVAASAHWYTTVLGLVPYAEDLDIGYVALRQPDANVVVVFTKGTGELEGSSPSGSGVLDHLAFAVSGAEALREWAEHLTALGVTHDGVVLENGRPSLQLRDPDGIAIELVA